MSGPTEATQLDLFAALTATSDGAPRQAVQPHPRPTAPARRTRPTAGPARRDHTERRGQPHRLPGTAESTEPADALDAVVDAIRDRFGVRAVGPAALVDADGLRVRRRSTTPWGPG